MRIVHISHTDTGGGAAIACIRHAEAMKDAGLDVNVLTAKKMGQNPIVTKPHWGWYSIVNQIQYSLHEWIISKIKPIGTFSIMQYGVPFHKTKEVKEADVIFLHWVNKNTLSIKGVEQLLKLNKPTFWYLHDMFPITGGCHYSLDCLEYQKDCKKCPLIENPKADGLAHKQLKWKIKHWSKYPNLYFIAPSIWLKDCIEHSSLAKNCISIVIPNLINTKVFKPYDFDVKKIFGLNPNKKTILFSSHLHGNIYKGSNYTINCLKLLDPSKYEGLIIGNMPKGLEESVPLKVIATGYLSDSISLVMAYNACDTLIISSIAENYPNVVLEAMACGKPCIGFKIGGIPDLISHKKTGYLTNEKTAEKLLDGIFWMFEDSHRYSIISQEARKQIVENNSYYNGKAIHSLLELCQNIKHS